MKPHALFAGLLLSLPALAQDVGDIAVLQDSTGAIHTPSGFEALQSWFCRAAARKFYETHPDLYDGVVTFTTRGLNDVENVQQGTPVRGVAQGIGRDSWRFPGAAAYGSAGRLSQCVFMGTLSKLPADPEGPATALLGLPLGLTAMELLGHEYGHHWLFSVDYDKADGLGRRDLLRGYEYNSNDPSQSYANNHWSAYTDSTSVMYGNFLQSRPPSGNQGTYGFTGGVRGYGALDQYLMGLRSTCEVPPVLAVDDGSGHGNPAVSTPRGQSLSVTGTGVEVTVEDVVRANGPRVPDALQSQKCWRVAFILVADGNTPPTQAQLDKVEAYRSQFRTWFANATGGRGSMDTRLSGPGCQSIPNPVAPRDCSQPAPEDGGTWNWPADAGEVSPSDAGEPESPGTEDGGTEDEDVDAGQPPGFNKDNIGKVRPGCGCSGGVSPGVPWLLALGAVLAAGRRRVGK
jgi:hypothetical protein